MMKFKTVESAKEYAMLNLKKNDWEIVDIDGKKTFLCDTSIPLERFFRDSIEKTVDNFLKLMGMEDENERCDISFFIGAEMSTKLIEMIEDNSPFGIESAFMDF